MKVTNMDSNKVKAATKRFLNKYPCKDNYDMSGMQLRQYHDVIEKASDNDIFETITDIYYHGFMNGAKQNKSDTEQRRENSDKIEKPKTKQSAECQQEKQSVAYRDGITEMVNSINEWRILRYIYLIVEDIVKEKERDNV